MKKYISPEIEIKRFFTEDIMVTSGMTSVPDAGVVDGSDDVTTGFDFPNDFKDLT